jgi:hypothetical protein
MNGICAPRQAVDGVRGDLIVLLGTLTEGVLSAVQSCTRLKQGTYVLSSGMPPELCCLVFLNAW